MSAALFSLAACLLLARSADALPPPSQRRIRGRMIIPVEDHDDAERRVLGTLANSIPQATTPPLPTAPPTAPPTASRAAATPATATTTAPPPSPRLPDRLDVSGPLPGAPVPVGKHLAGYVGCLNCCLVGDWTKWEGECSANTQTTTSKAKSSSEGERSVAREEMRIRTVASAPPTTTDDATDHLDGCKEHFKDMDTRTCEQADIATSWDAPRIPLAQMTHAQRVARRQKLLYKDVQETEEAEKVAKDLANQEASGLDDFIAKHGLPGFGSAGALFGSPSWGHHAALHPPPPGSAESLKLLAQRDAAASLRPAQCATAVATALVAAWVAVGAGR